MVALGCGEHTSYIYERGGTKMLFQLDAMIVTAWQRTRDDISQAHVVVSAHADCCEQLGSVSSGFNELHVYRSGVSVWQGIVTRVEYERDKVTVFAEDMLWVAKNTVLDVGYNKAYPNIAKGGWVMNWLLTTQTYSKYGDPWKMASHVHWQQGSDDPSTSAAVKAWSMTTWEDFDKFAEDRGMDYTVAGRDIYFWDTHLKWRTLDEDLVSEYLLGDMAVVEYGNEMATRVIVTNGNGYASQAVAPAWAITKYGYIDHVESSFNEAAANEAPTNEEKKAWQEQAQSNLDHAFPAPVRIRVSENSELSPDAPYDINDLIAGSWVRVVVDDLCRTLDQWHKLDSVDVHEEGGKEVITISTQTAPEHVVEP